MNELQNAANVLLTEVIAQWQLLLDQMGDFKIPRPLVTTATSGLRMSKNARDFLNEQS